MKQEIDNKRNIAIMYIRVIAMLFIFIDHAVTYMDIPLKSVIIQITNSGNLIFLFISGFLYGGKMINDFKRWAIKRLIRLWIPYFIFILAYFAYSHFFLRNGDSTVASFFIYVFVLQGLLGTEGGPISLWFLTLLMICYFILPILQLVRNKLVQNKYRYFIFTTATVIIVLLQLVLAFWCDITLDFEHPLSWYLVAVFIFACGYFSNTRFINYGIHTHQVIIWTIVVIVSMLVRLFSQRIMDGTILYDRVISIWTNVCLDIWIIYVIYYVVQRWAEQFDCKVIRCADKISYTFYLVHATVLAVIHSVTADGKWLILVSLILTILLAYGLNYVATKVQEFVNDG